MSSHGIPPEEFPSRRGPETPSARGIGGGSSPCREDRSGARLPADLASELVGLPGGQQAASVAGRVGVKDRLCAVLLVDFLEQDGQRGAFTLVVGRRVELDILVAEVLVEDLGILRELHARERLPCSESSPATFRRGW